MEKETSENLKIFVVEDDKWYREFLSYNLLLVPEYEVKMFENGKDSLMHLYERPDIITLDLTLPDLHGTEVLKKIKEFDPYIEVIVVSGQDKLEVAVEMLKQGAYDYLVKTDDLREKLLHVVNNIRKKNRLKEKITHLEQEVSKKYEFGNIIIGQSPAIKAVFRMIEKAVQTDINISITGETGTGKELVAKAVHYNSKRRNGPLVAVNLSAVPKELVESELFGHEKGSFTGAATKRIGRFEQANGGTIFLDEVTDMQPHLQVKLLRVLQEREISRVGSNATVKVDCRIIAASNKSLQEEVKKGNFREDLYYRLLGLNIHLPPLRERGTDILLLAKHFLEHFAKDNNLELKALSKEAQKKLLNYSFPGNVRELKSVVELAAVLSDSDTISPDDLVFSEMSTPVFVPEQETTLRNYIKKLIRSYLEKYNNDVLLVARKLDIGKSTIYRMLQEEKTRTRNDFFD
ncbi:MAG: sigma-54-dependent Fis family transcriptional regulator [Bacteroidetes bacterium]|nr:sigma-54-dependent Fis family transcriptional regulator [Bacteroidota bacterium]HET6245926.1 sigma-54 dependent transcriptional regulator [Bacteroidia bacterium]